MIACALVSAPLLALALAAATGTPAKTATRAPAARHANPVPADKNILPWIEDDWPRAVAEAKARKLPIFVESWAPW